MKLGITGTRYGLTEMQRRSLSGLLSGGLKCTELHHGACKGADYEAVGCYLRAVGLTHVVAHPGKSAKGDDNEWLSQDALDLSNEIRPVKTHFARNRTIVDETDVLLALPGNMEPITEETRGGTAYTVLYGKKKHKPVYIVRPDGSIEWPEPNLETSS